MSFFGLRKNPKKEEKINLDLVKSVYDHDASSKYVTVQGEVDIDISRFRGQSYSIGIGLLSQSGQRLDWNQDGPRNYVRTEANSLIRIESRVTVDSTCYVKFTVRVPVDYGPGWYKVEARAYSIENAYNAYEPREQPFRIIVRTRGSGVRT